MKNFRAAFLFGVAWLQLAGKFSNLTARHLRRQAEEAPDEKFDIREFHDVVPRNGAIPLSTLEGEVKAYVCVYIMRSKILRTEQTCHSE